MVSLHAKEASDQPSFVEPARGELLAEIAALKELFDPGKRGSWLAHASLEHLSEFGLALADAPIAMGDATREMICIDFIKPGRAGDLADSIATLLESFRLAVRFDPRLEGERGARRTAPLRELISDMRAYIEHLPEISELEHSFFPGLLSREPQHSVADDFRRAGRHAPISGEELLRRLREPRAEEPETLELLLRLAEQRLSEGRRYFREPGQISAALDEISKNPVLAEFVRSQAQRALRFLDEIGGAFIKGC
jgi:hypothetical protein